MRFGSLFSGVGGFDLGLERAGHECVWQVEIDPFCRRVLEKHWPDVPKYKDVRDVKGGEVAEVDFLCGGFPCQPVSLAGKGLADLDDRWLWPEFARLVREIRPRYVVVENVPGLLVRGMGDVLGDLASLGYDAEWDCLPAATFGAPQRRDRVFIVAYPNTVGWSRGAERHVIPSGRLEPPRRHDVDGLDLVECGPWSSLPHPVSVDYGTPGIVGALSAYGNAVVPQVAEWIGHRLNERT